MKCGFPFGFLERLERIVIDFYSESDLFVIHLFVRKIPSLALSARRVSRKTTKPAGMGGLWKFEHVTKVLATAAIESAA